MKRVLFYLLLTALVTFACKADAQPYDYEAHNWKVEQISKMPIEQMMDQFDTTYDSNLRGRIGSMIINKFCKMTEPELKQLLVKKFALTSSCQRLLGIMTRYGMNPCGVLSTPVLLNARYKLDEIGSIGDRKQISLYVNLALTARLPKIPQAELMAYSKLAPNLSSIRYLLEKELAHRREAPAQELAVKKQLPEIARQRELLYQDYVELDKRQYYERDSYKKHSLRQERDNLGREITQHDEILKKHAWKDVLKQDGYQPPSTGTQADTHPTQLTAALHQDTQTAKPPVRSVGDYGTAQVYFVMKSSWEANIIGAKSFGDLKQWAQSLRPFHGVPTQEFVDNAVNKSAGQLIKLDVGSKVLIEEGSLSENCLQYGRVKLLDGPHSGESYWFGVLYLNPHNHE